MEFTDADLATTKKELKLGYTTLTTTGGMQALIARLEAAEEFGEMMCLTYPEAEQTILYKAWRKSAGH